MLARASRIAASRSMTESAARPPGSGPSQPPVAHGPGPTCVTARAPERTTGGTGVAAGVVGPTRRSFEEEAQVGADSPAATGLSLQTPELPGRWRTPGSHARNFLYWRRLPGSGTPCPPSATLIAQ